jgi:hypothetical protein
MSVLHEENILSSRKRRPTKATSKSYESCEDETSSNCSPRPKDNKAGDSFRTCLEKAGPVINLKSDLVDDDTILNRFLLKAPSVSMANSLIVGNASNEQHDKFAVD